jgi:uncharacterized membrane protein YtjA (UPF0391 family)
LAKQASPAGKTPALLKKHLPEDHQLQGQPCNSKPAIRPVRNRFSRQSVCDKDWLGIARLLLGRSRERRRLMLYWALVFLVIAVVAGLLGFGGVASAASSIAQVLFFVFLVVFVIALIMGLMARRGPPAI